MSALTKDGIALLEHPVKEFPCPYCHAGIRMMLDEPDWVKARWLAALKQENDRLRAVVHRLIEAIENAVPSDSARLICDALRRTP